MLAALLVACSGGQSTDLATREQSTSLPTETGAMDVPAPLYAALFEENRTFVYDMYAEDSPADPMDTTGVNGDGNIVTESVMTCTVLQASPVGVAVASELMCEGGGSGFGLVVVSGIYVATADGLWYLGETGWPDESVLGELAPDRQLMAANPVPVNNEEQEDGGFGSTEVVAAQPEGGWCRTESSWGGDEGGEHTCLVEGRGITEAMRFWAGGSYHALTATLRP